ncbi:MAG: IclR family transcriptional regulator, pca regulon regulatory protein [Pseudonocardiales bacterium]|nr:IclR family transcriptional regulator, pca regulon regulatory protein [Pseudonocardiales bacterium]MDT7772005.1 IclR family transcriptional regulator, pca regulon regulatory protein [Pseudonocardiales bacterium]
METSGADPVKGSGASELSARVSARAPEGMAGLAKGLAVIEAFGGASSQLTVSEAAELTNVTRAAARRCLLTLAELGYLSHDGKHFRPTPRMLRLGGAYLDTAPLPALAQPHLIAARDQLGESVSLAVWQDGWSLFVARAEAQRLVATGVRIGARLPAHCSATGKVLLAGLPEAELAAFLAAGGWPRRTAHTLVTTGAVADAVREAAESGFATSDEELELGMRALAVPVWDARGRTVAAMSVSTSTARVTAGELRDHFRPILAERATLLGKNL